MPLSKFSQTLSPTVIRFAANVKRSGSSTRAVRADGPRVRSLQMVCICSQRGWSMRRIRAQGSRTTLHINHLREPSDRPTRTVYRRGLLPRSACTALTIRVDRLCTPSAQTARADRSRKSSAHAVFAGVARGRFARKVPAIRSCEQFGWPNRADRVDDPHGRLVRVVREWISCGGSARWLRGVCPRGLTRSAPAVAGGSG